jgi:hypothetical protein
MSEPIVANWTLTVKSNDLDGSHVGGRVVIRGMVSLDLTVTWYAKAADVGDLAVGDRDLSEITGGYFSGRAIPVSVESHPTTPSFDDDERVVRADYAVSELSTMQEAD